MKKKDTIMKILIRFHNIEERKNYYLVYFKMVFIIK